MKHKDFWKEKVVAVTGSSGFVGCEIVNKLRELDVVVIEISRRTGVDVTNFPQLLKALKPANYIISTAAIDGNTDYKNKNSQYILEENIKIISNLLAAASRLKIYNLTILSSAAVYGPNETGSYSEDYDFISNGNENLGGYALSKRISELMGIEFAQKYGGKVLIPRPTNIYGKNDPHLRVIESMSQKIQLNKEIQILGDGTDLRSFIFIDDFVTVLLKLIQALADGPINIAGPEKTRVIDLAHLIALNWGKKPKITFTLAQTPQLDRVLDVKLLESLIQFDYTPLREGLAKSLKQ